MPPRAARKRKALQEVQNASVNGLGTSQDLSQFEYLDAIQDMIDNIDRAGTWSSACSRVSRPRRRPTCRNSVVVSHSTISPCAVEEKIHEINQATKNAVASLNTTLKTRLVRLPKALKMMPLEELPGKTGATGPGLAGSPLASTGAEMKPAAVQKDDATGTRGTRAVRGARGNCSTREKSPNDVGKACAAQNAATSPGAEADATFKASPPLFSGGDPAPSPPPVQFTRAKKRAGPVDTSTDALPSMSYNGLPLQTPMPFSGKAVPMPVQLLTVQAQGKRAGGKTKASRNAPQAAVVTTKDGKQWAVGVNGLRDIPESHRAEVGEYLRSQFSFLQDALNL